MRSVIFMLSMTLMMLGAYGQEVELSATDLSSSMLKDKAGNEYGKGCLQKYSAKLTIPLSTKQDRLGRPSMWILSVNGHLGVLDNKDEAKELNPDRLVNASANVSHVRHFSQKWCLIASLGAGIYAEPDHIRWNTLLVNGAAIFTYHWMPEVDVGLGGALTNSYGMPLLVPVAYLSWNKQGRYSLQVNMLNGMRIAGGVNLTDALKLKLTALEMDGMSAVINYYGSTRLYTSTMMRSYLQVEYHFAKKSWLSIGTGSNFLRTSSTRKRRLGSLFEHHSEEEKRRFKPTWLLNATVHIRF